MDFALKKKKLKKLSMRAKGSKKLQENNQQVVYLRKPENDWPSEESKDDLHDEMYNEVGQQLPPPNFNTKIERNLPENEGELGNIPSLTYKQKMTNWFVLNKSCEEEKRDSEGYENYEVSKFETNQNAKSKVRERNRRLKLLEKQINVLSPGSEQLEYLQEERFQQEQKRHHNVMRGFGRHTTTPGLIENMESSSDENNKEVKYTRLFDGAENIKGDFEKAKRNMGVTQEPPTKEEIRQQRWDVVIHRHLQEKIEATQKGYVDVSRERERNKQKYYSNLDNESEGRNNKHNQMDIINGLRKSIREMSLKMAMTPPPDFPQLPNEYTVPELKCLLELQSKGPIPKFSVGQLRKLLNSLGFTRNVVNYNDFVDKLENVAMKKYGCSLSSKKLKGYIRKQSDKLIYHQEVQSMKKKASTERIHRKIAAANQNISAFLKGAPRARNTESVSRRPLMKLFPPTYSNNSNVVDQSSKTYIPPKTYREKKRIRESDEFWKKYGKEDYEQPNWNKFRMDLEWKHRAGLIKGPGFPVQIKEKYPLIFGNDEAPVKLSSNFTTPELIAALNRIIHHPMPLEQMMTGYEKKVNEYRKKFPRLFRFEQKGQRLPMFKKEE